MNSSLLVSEARPLRQNLSSPARNSYDIVSDTTKVSANRRGAPCVRWHVTNKVTFIGVMLIVSAQVTAEEVRRLMLEIWYQAISIDTMRETAHAVH
jgi:hypothetical protein